MDRTLLGFIMEASQIDEPDGAVNDSINHYKSDCELVEILA